MTGLRTVTGLRPSLNCSNCCLSFSSPWRAPQLALGWCVMRMSPMLWTGLGCALALTLAMPGLTRNAKSDQAIDDSSKAVIGTIGGRKVTEAEVVAGDRDEFAAQDADYAIRL